MDLKSPPYGTDLGTSSSYRNFPPRVLFLPWGVVIQESLSGRVRSIGPEEGGTEGVLSKESPRWFGGDSPGLEYTLPPFSGFLRIKTRRGHKLSVRRS